jgi:hypothetical protein
MVRSSWRKCLCLSVAVLSLGGCGGRGSTREGCRGPVTGTVTIDGKTLGGGSITFVCIDDPKYRVVAPLRGDGTFSVADAPLGRVRVAVETESTRVGNPGSYTRIPEKYGKPDTSGLTATIDKQSGQPIVIELVSR